MNMWSQLILAGLIALVVSCDARGDTCTRSSVLNSRCLQDNLKRVVQDCVGISKDEREKKRRIVEQLVKKVRQDPKINGHVKDVFYAGSAYEKLQAGEADDFDIQLFADLSSTSTSDWKLVDKDNVGQWWEIIYVGKSAPSTVQPFLEDNKLSALKTRQLFKGLIDRVIRDAQNGMRVTTSSQGPAITLHISKDNLKFTIDLVIAIRGIDVGTKSDYVAKPFDKSNPLSSIEGSKWRISFSQREGAMFDRMDKGNGVRRLVLRTIKQCRRHSPQLKMLPNYVYKNILLHATTQFPSQDQWTNDKLADRFSDMIVLIRNKLKGGIVEVFFEPRINLLEGKPPSSIKQVVNYLTNIIDKGEAGYNSLLEKMVT